MPLKWWAQNSTEDLMVRGVSIHLSVLSLFACPHFPTVSHLGFFFFFSLWKDKILGFYILCLKAMGADFPRLWHMLFWILDMGFGDNVVMMLSLCVLLVNFGWLWFKGFASSMRSASDSLLWFGFVLSASSIELCVWFWRWVLEDSEVNFTG